MQRINKHKIFKLYNKLKQQENPIAYLTGKDWKKKKGEVRKGGENALPALHLTQASGALEGRWDFRVGTSVPFDPEVRADRAGPRRACFATEP